MSIENPESERERRVYSAHLSDDDITALRRLLGMQVYQLFSSSIESNRMLLTAPSFSVSVDDHTWVVIRSEWLETPMELVDYFQLSVRFTDAPDRIRYTAQGVLVNPSEVLIVPGAKVTAIEVLSLEHPKDGIEREQVKYDSAMRFLREDGRHFCLVAEQSITARLQFTEDHATMTEILRESSVRLRIE